MRFLALLMAGDPDPDASPFFAPLAGMLNSANVNFFNIEEYLPVHINLWDAAFREGCGTCFEYAALSLTTEMRQGPEDAKRCRRSQRSDIFIENRKSGPFRGVKGKLPFSLAPVASFLRRVDGNKCRYLK